MMASVWDARRFDASWPSVKSSSAVVGTEEGDSSLLRVPRTRPAPLSRLALQTRTKNSRSARPPQRDVHRKRLVPSLWTSSAALTEIEGDSGHTDGLDVEYSLKRMLVELRNGPVDGRLRFSPELSARQRRLAHEISERLGLGHQSFGQGIERCFTAWRLSVTERLSQLCNLLDVEGTASKENFAMERESQSRKTLEAQGMLLYNASIAEREAASFGRERWVVVDGVGLERAGHVGRFAQRARPGMPICFAERNSDGSWVTMKEEPSGRVAWSRGKKLCFVFDRPPTASEQITSADFLLVHDSSSFERMRSVTRDCASDKNGTNIVLEALLGSGLWGLSGTISGPSRTRDNLQSTVLHGGRPFDEGLNVEQEAAVRMCLGHNRSPVVLIHGPFGTGKTRTLVEVVRQHVAAGRRVLVCAASNAAVDHMVQALLNADKALPIARAGMTERVSSSVSAFTVEALQEKQPEAAIARRLRKEARALQLTAEKWTRASSGAEKRKNARKEVRALFKDAQRLDKMCAVSVLQKTKVLCGTLTGFASVLQEVGDVEDTKFHCAVVDEASQVITPALLLVLPYLNYQASEPAKRPLLVLAGDHQQLPPTVLSSHHDDRHGGLEATIFEELMERDGGGLGRRIETLTANEEQWENVKYLILRSAVALASGTKLDIMRQSDTQESPVAGRISVALCQQYRMPAQLMAFPSAAFYSGQLISRPRDTTKSADTREAFILHEGSLLEVIDTAGAGFEEEKIGEVRPSLASRKSADVFSTRNIDQANLTIRVVRELLMSASYSTTNIGVITPYTAQVTLLKSLMADEVEKGLEIDSVDAYQGREKEVIVMDAVRSNIEGTVGFLADFHRLNVAITRARSKLIVIADSATLSVDPIWAVFFEWVSEYRDKPLTGIRYQSSFEIPTEGGW